MLKRQTYLQVPGGLLTESALSAEAFEFRLLRVEGPTARWSLGPRETTTLTQSPGCWGSELPKVATLSLSSRLIPSWVGLPKSRCNILSFNDEHSLAKSDLFTLKVQPLTESWPNKTLLLKEMKNCLYSSGRACTVRMLPLCRFEYIQVHRWLTRC